MRGLCQSSRTETATAPLSCQVLLWHRKELQTDGPNPRETAEREDQDALNSGGDDENQESDGGSDSASER